MNLLNFARILQIVASIIIIVLVMIQNKSGGLSGSVGSSINNYRSRRGVEKVILVLTIFFIVVLVMNSLVLITSS